jgi:hypothetical protein
LEYVQKKYVFFFEFQYASVTGGLHLPRQAGVSLETYSSNFHSLNKKSQLKKKTKYRLLQNFSEQDGLIVLFIITNYQKQHLRLAMCGGELFPKEKGQRRVVKG